jgi:hypothetical protein
MHDLKKTLNHGTVPFSSHEIITYYNERSSCRENFPLLNKFPSFYTFYMLTDVCFWRVSLKFESTPQPEIPLYCRTILILYPICSCIPFCPLTHLDFCLRALMYNTHNEIRCRVAFVDHQRNSW